MTPISNFDHEAERVELKARISALESALKYAIDSLAMVQAETDQGLLALNEVLHGK